MTFCLQCDQKLFNKMRSKCWGQFSMSVKFCLVYNLLWDDFVVHMNWLSGYCLQFSPMKLFIRWNSTYSSNMSLTFYIIVLGYSPYSFLFLIVFSYSTTMHKKKLLFCLSWHFSNVLNILIFNLGLLRKMLIC